MAKIGPLQITEKKGVSPPVLLPTTSMTSANVPVQKIPFMDYSIGQAHAQASVAVAQELGAMVEKVGKAALYVAKVKKQHEKVKIGTEWQEFQDEFQRNWASEPTLGGRQKLYDDYIRSIPKMQAGIDARLGTDLEDQEYKAQLGVSARKLSANSFVKLENQRLQETDSLAVLQNKVLAKKFATDPSMDVRTGIQTGTATIQGRIDTGAITEETGAILKTDFVSAALTNRATLMGRLTAKYYANNPTDIPETAAEISAVFQDRMGDIVLSESDSEVALDSFTSTFHKELRLQLSLAKEADAALREKNKDFIRLLEDEMKEGEDKLTLTREKVEIIANSLDLKGLEEEAGKIRSRGRAYFEKGQVDLDTHMYWTQEGSEGRDLLVSKGFLSKESGYWKESDAKEFVRNSGVTHPATLNGILRTLRGEDAKRIDDYTTESQINNSMVPYLHKSRIALKYLDPKSWNDYTVTQRAEGTYIKALSNISTDLGRLMSTVKKKVETARLNASNDPKSPFNEKAFANPTKQGQDYDKLIHRLVKETHDEIQASKGKQGEPKVTVKTLEEATAAVDATDKKAVENGQFGSEEAKEEHQENKNIIKKETALLKTPPHQEGAVVKELTAEGEFKTENELKQDKIMEKSQIVAPLIKLGENIVTLKKRMGTDTPPAMKKYMKQRGEVVEGITKDIGEVVEDITDDIGAVFGSAYDAVTKQLGEEFSALGTLFGGDEEEVAPEPQVVSEEGTKVLQDLIQQFDALPKDEQEHELQGTYNQIAFDTATELSKETPNEKVVAYYFQVMHGLKKQYGDYKLNDPEIWVDMIRQNQSTMKFETQPTMEPDSPERYADIASRFINQVGARMGFAPTQSIEDRRQELEAVRGQEIFDKLPESMKVDPPTKEMLDAQRGQASFDQSPESEKIDSPANMDMPTIPLQYTMKKGDTLWGLGQRFGIDYRRLAEINKIDDPTKLQIGRVLDFVGLSSAPAVESYDFIGEQDTPSKRATKSPEPITRTAPHQKGIKGEDILTWNTATNKFESDKKSPVKWMKTLANQMMGLPKEDLLTVLSFMPIPAIAGAAVPMKVIQAWLKTESKTYKYKSMGEGVGMTLGATEKGLVGEVRDFVQQIFMHKGLEKVLKKGVSVRSKHFHAKGIDFNIKGPITKKEFEILTDAKAKSRTKYIDERASQPRPIYMKFRGKKVEVDELAQMEDEIRRQMFGEIKIGDLGLGRFSADILP